MADEKDLIDQSEIEKLLGGGGGGGASEPADAGSGDDPLNQDDIEALLGGGGGGGGQAAAASSPAAQPAGAVEDADKLLSQDDIESLLAGAGGGDPGGGAAPQPAAAAPATAHHHGGMPGDGETLFAGEGDVSQQDMEYLLNQAEEALDSVVGAKHDLPGNVLEFSLPEFGGAPPSTENATLDLLSEVELDVKIELGRTEMFLEDILKLRRGSVVPLDKLAGDPVDIYVNGRLVARGEVLVMNDNFCVRVAELVASSSPAE